MTRDGMPRAYLRIDPNIDQTMPDLESFIRLMCAAARQPERGRFKDRRLLERAIGRAKAVKALSRGDVVTLPDGRLYVDGWDEWQEGDVTVGERMRRMRARRNRGVTTPSPPRNDVTTDAVANDGASSTASGDGVDSPPTPPINGASDGRADLEAFLLIKRRAPTARQRQLLDGVVDRHDLTGPQWAADIMMRHPDDPIGAVIEADKAWRAERIAEAQAAEKPTPKPHRPRGLPESTRELIEHWAAQAKEQA